MTISKKDALVLIESMETHIFIALQGYNDELYETFSYHRGFCSSIAETVKLVQGKGSDLFAYMNGRRSWLICNTKYKALASISTDYNGFMIRTVGTDGHVYIAGCEMYDNFPTVDEAKAMIDRIRALFTSKTITV